MVMRHVEGGVKPRTSVNDGKGMFESAMRNVREDERKKICDLAIDHCNKGVRNIVPLL